MKRPTLNEGHIRMLDSYTSVRLHRGDRRIESPCRELRLLENAGENAVSPKCEWEMQFQKEKLFNSKEDLIKRNYRSSVVSLQFLSKLAVEGQVTCLVVVSRTKIENLTFLQKINFLGADQF